MFEKQSLGGFLFGFVIASATGVNAQSIVPSTVNGLNTSVDQIGNQYNITGGTQAGTNLFYSLQKLGLSTGEIANFLSNPSVDNILTRVTGGEASLINGLLQVTGGNSNLFLMNPAGIVFGNNASLNVPANFSATTATGIKIGDAWFRMNSSADQVANLTGNVNGYGFTNVLPSLDGNPTGIISNEGNLAVNTGKSVTLVGGMVVNTGSIATPQGRITIAATPDNKFIKISNEGSVLSFDLPIADQQVLGNAPVLSGVDLPNLLRGKTAGNAQVQGTLTAANIDVLSDRYNSSQANLNAPNVQQGWNYVFVDSAVKNYQTLVDGTTGGSNVNVIDKNQSGISAISKTLANVSGANSLHIVSEGDKGSFWVGKDFINNDRLGLYSKDLADWKSALSPAGELMLYACNLAGDLNGQTLVQNISKLVGAPVAASTDRTGGAVSNANWNLEYSTAAVRPSAIFTQPTIANYANALATLTVTDSGDAGADTLRGKIASANANDDIKFFGVSLITLTSDELAIDKNLTINGAGAVTVSGDNTYRVFNIGASNPSTVSIDGLTITKGDSNNGAGLYINSGSTLSIANSTFSENASSSYGGAIYNDNGTISSISNSTFSENVSGNAIGGAIYNYRGNISSIANSNFSSNTAAGEGGAIYNDNGTISEIANNTFSDNTAIRGGAIYNYGTISSIANSTFSGNAAYYSHGGAIYNFGTISSITNSTFSGNIANRNGGAIYNYRGNISSITNSTFSGNIANRNGGAIFNNDTIALIANSTFSGNTATFGGAIFNDTGTVISSIANSILVGNNAPYGNGPEIINYGALTFTGANIVGTNGVNGIDGDSFLGVTPLVPTSAASTVINTTLADNGGATKTHALVTGSIAINASGAGATTSDQRGFAAVGTRDIGAFEFGGVPPITTPTPPNIEPTQETHQDHEDKKEITVFPIDNPELLRKHRNEITQLLSNQTLLGNSNSNTESVAFFLSNEVDIQQVNKLILQIVDLMNQEGGDLQISTQELWQDSDINLVNQSVNQDIIKVLIHGLVNKFIGADYLSLVDVDFVPKDQDKNEKVIQIKVRKSPQFVKIKEE